ncbi:nucleotide disphospho-sugar-binding domain-containing protein [Streptomyces sp. 2A115]|uniref:nucleotide disphospho-sugar-binding domain-containing protein n=1 Tax=Streptomyces sp. 2A115 TaxID=3457439 RepID=UPI003FD11F8E
MPSPRNVLTVSGSAVPEQDSLLTLLRQLIAVVAFGYGESSVRVLMAVWPAPAHLYPVVPLAWALQSAGHEVVIASHPNMAATISSVGLTAVPLGDAGSMPTPRAATRPVPPAMDEELDRVEKTLGVHPSDYPWDIFRRFILPAIWDFHPAHASPSAPQPGIDDLVSYARAWQPDLVIWDPCWPSAAVAARVSGAAHVRLLWGLDYWGWVTERFAKLVHSGGAVRVENPLLHSVRPVAERYGIDVDEELLLGQWTIDPLPNGMQLTTNALTVPVRWVPFTGTGPLPQWLREAAERPRVAISLGVSVRQFFKDSEALITTMLASVADLNIEVVATLDKEQTAGIHVPRNVRAVDYLPLNQLLPSCSAIIHHGGIGTFAASAAMRVPQLITDGEAEIVVQHDDGTLTSFTHKHMDAPPTSEYVLAHGAGLVLDREKHSADELSKQLARVLAEPSFQAGADRIHDRMLATPSPHDVVPLLERMSSRYKTRTLVGLGQVG